MRDDIKLNSTEERHARALKIAKSRRARNIQLSAKTEPTFSYSRPSSYSHVMDDIEKLSLDEQKEMASFDPILDQLINPLKEKPTENELKDTTAEIIISQEAIEKAEADNVTQETAPQVETIKTAEPEIPAAPELPEAIKESIISTNAEESIDNESEEEAQPEEIESEIKPKGKLNGIFRRILRMSDEERQFEDEVSANSELEELEDSKEAIEEVPAVAEIPAETAKAPFIKVIKKEEAPVAEETGKNVEASEVPVIEETDNNGEVSEIPVAEEKEKKKLSLAGIFNRKKNKDASESIDGGDKGAPGSPGNKKKEQKVERPKAKKSTTVLAILTSIVLFIGICGVLGAGIFAWYLCKDMPDLKAEDLVAPDSSVIYDAEGNKIMEIGMYLRENVDYEEMPNSLIDAFLAIEDSRYFSHMGFDIPRFTKAILVNLASRDFSQGGSTITMQLIKNTYYSIDADGDSKVASRDGMSGVKRKMQEIVMAIETTFMKDLDKRKIMAMYINKVNYGDNIRGVEKAAEYYFGKRSTELTLGESAFLAGLINSPSSYNPYNELYKYDSIYLDPESEYLANGQNRRDEVLDLMVYHGYITEEEAELEKSVRIEDLLKGVSKSFQYTNESYQWYIDAVIDEAIETTGESPYDVGMNIYTNMSPYLQQYMYDMQNEAEYTGISFPNELCQSALVLMNNQNGAIIALGGGRGEIDSARQFNRATSAYLNPGSSIKPIIDYALAIEKLGWATTHVITDRPYYLYDGPILISNYDHIYHGDMTILEALARSQNTPAVQTLAAVVDAIGEEAVVDYMNSIGYDFEYEDFDLQFAIGGNRCLVTPLQMAGAHAMFMNGGRYIKPHTIERIEYVDGRDDFIADTVGSQLLSQETAYMMAQMENYNMDGSFSSLMWYCKRDYPLYGKTGTTDWADSGKDYGIPEGSTKDSWLVMQTNQYTISCWTGYDRLEEGAYFSNAEYQENTKSKLVSKILDQLEEHAPEAYDPTRELARPEGVVDITHVLGAYPYCYPSGGYQTVTGLINKKALDEKPLVSVGEALTGLKTKVVSGFISSVGGSYDGNNIWVSVTTAGANTNATGDLVDISETNAYNETTHAVGRSYFPHFNYVFTGEEVTSFSFNIIVDGNIVFSNTTSDMNMSFEYPGNRASACVWTDNPENQICVDLPRP